MSPSSFWFLELGACYFIFSEDLALCTGYRRASLINFHHWLEMKKKKPKFFTFSSFFFFFKIPSCYFAWKISCRNNRSLYSILPVSLCFSIKNDLYYEDNEISQKGIHWQKKYDLLQVGCCHSSLQPAISKNRNKTNFTCEHNCITVCIERYWNGK